MKALVLSMISIAATVAAMTACTSESDPVDEATKDIPVEIKLNAGVIQTKAAIDVDENKHPKNKVTNVYFFREDAATDVTPTWTSPSTSFTGSIETTGSISDFTQYYATNGNNAHIVGLYLGTTEGIPTVSDGTVPFSIDGSQDVLWAASTNVGNRNVQATTPLDFKHKLTKFTFVAKTNNGIGEVTGINIAIQNAKASSTIKLSDGSLGTWTAATPSELTISGLTAVANGGSSTESEGVMLQPNLKSIIMNVSAENYLSEAVSLEINGTEGTGNDTFLEGKSYTITITFTGQAVTATATIADWDKGTNPSEGTIN